MHLFETHVPVKNTETARSFYQEIVGLEFAHRDPVRDIVFLWIGSDRRSMVGLWGPDTHYGVPRKCHFAIAVSLPQLVSTCGRLNDLGIHTRNFFGDQTTEPSVIGWMPSAQIYFSDPDGHALEFIAMLDERPDPDFLGPLSTWKQRALVGPR
jgi:lactoylglutathione lyase